MSHIDWTEIDPVKFFTIGPTLFLGVRFVLYPAALVKTRLQIQSLAPHKQTSGPTTHNAEVVRGGSREIVYRGTWHAFRTIARAEGVPALWKGFLAKSVSLVAGNIYITIYEVLRSKMLASQQFSTLQADMLSGGIASLISQIIVVPSDMVSQRLAVKQQGASFRTTQLMRALLKEAGVKGLYRGYAASVMTYAPTSAVWWASYGKYKPVIQGALANFLHQKTLSDRLAESISGGFAGCSAGLLTNPMDVIKVRRQLAGVDVSTRGITSELYASEGFRGFTRGATARMLSMSSSGALIITVYEFIKRLSRRGDPEEQKL